MSKTILALACLFIATSAIHLSHEQNEEVSDDFIVNIKGSNGKYLSSSNGFDEDIGAYPVSASVSESDPTKPWTKWVVQVNGDKIALKSVDTGKYLSRCNNCWYSVKNSKWDDSAFVHVDDQNNGDWALWTATQLENGKWTLLGDNG